jgi:NADH-quinone oxidoreductase subunit L
MGGLAKKMPITAAAWIVSTLALAGVFPLSGFFSKDEIIDNVGHNGYEVFMWISLGGAFMTAAYMARATYLTFFGEPRGAAAGEHHDSHDPAYAHGEEHALDAIDERELVGAAVGGGSVGHGVTPDDHDAHDAHDAHDGGHDDHGAHAGPHESGPLILVPIVILAILAGVAGLVNAVPFGEDWEQFKKYVEPRPEAVVLDDVAAAIGGPGESVYVVEVGALPRAEGEAGGCGFEAPEEGTVCLFPAVSHAEFKWSKALVSLVIVAFGLVGGWLFCVAFYTRRHRALVGLTERFAPARWGYRFLANKYYLDDLYEKGVVHAVAHPIADGAYWVNQNVIDEVVDTAGRATTKAGGWVYRNIDQRVIDGSVNAAGTVASETGHALQPVQSGKVSMYGALLFGAAAVGAIVLVILNV